MTQNQIAYWNLVETRRSNQAKERENTRSNTAKERENYRSNLAREQETATHNRIVEANDIRNLQENKRSNQARERETNRTNLANEDIRRTTNTNNWLNTQMNRNLEYDKLNETKQRRYVDERLANIRQQEANTNSGYLTLDEAEKIWRRDFDTVKLSIEKDLREKGIQADVINNVIRSLSGIVGSVPSYFGKFASSGTTKPFDPVEYLP
nr:putative ORF1 [Marmot picobirnavirus]